MRRLLLWSVSLFAANFLFAQRECRSFEYQKQLIQIDPSLEASRQGIENFIFQHESTRLSTAIVEGIKIITIPVIVHILYPYPGENISDDLVKSQLTALNRDFRKTNADTTKIPPPFRPLAADCQIEFQLATVDAAGRATTGIIHKYTPITKWSMDDKIKSSAGMGDDAW